MAGMSGTAARRIAAAVIAVAALAPAGWAQDPEVIVSHAITTFGDPPKYPADFPHLDYVNPDAPKGGEIAVHWIGNFDTMNPYSDKGVPAYLSTIGIEDMMVATADEIGALYCLICETIEYPADKSWVIFNMRPEARFADGSELTADDVKFTTDTFAVEGLSSFRLVLNEFVESVEVLDKHRVRYTFKADSPLRDRIQMAGGMPVMSKAWFERTGAKMDESRLEPAMGSGPYVLDRFDIGERIVYRRNPDYWGRDLPINRGRANFDTIRVEYFADPTAAFEAFKSGTYTFRNENNSRIWATQYNFPALNEGWVKKELLEHGQIANGQSWVFNLRRAKFQDARVREALGLMFNFEWSNATLFYGIYARISGFFENSELAASGPPSAEELALLQPLADKLPPGVLEGEAVMAPTSGERQLDRANLRKAAALLDEAGWTAGADGLRRNAAGEVLSVEFLEDGPDFDRIINPYIENLKALGVDAKLTRVDPSEFEFRIRYSDEDPSRAFNFDVVTKQFPLGYEPGPGLKQYLASQSVNDVFNVMGLADPAVDALLGNVIAAQSKDEMVTAAKALDRTLRALKFWVPQWHKPAYTVAYFDMFERPATLPPYALGELDFWWYNAEKAEALRSAGALN